MSASPPDIYPPTPANIRTLAGMLREGRLVAFPTETVYGLGADATNDDAVAAVFAAKGRPSFNPLICHFADEDAVGTQVRFTRTAALLAEAFWPGPLTLVLRRRQDCTVSLLASAGLDTLAVRVPSHPVARALLQATGRPVAAPSANRSGSVSPTTARHVADSLGGEIDAILDGGACEVGLESTVIAFDEGEPVLLRPGGIPAEDIEAAAGRPCRGPADGSAPRSPGMLARHYAPATPLRLDATDARPGEVLLGFGPDMPADAPRGSLNLSPTGDLREAAANLFAMLRRLDAAGHAGIAVMPVPEEGLGRAINDRLRRAASMDAGGAPAHNPAS